MSSTYVHNIKARPPSHSCKIYPKAQLKTIDSKRWSDTRISSSSKSKFGFYSKNYLRCPEEAGKNVNIFIIDTGFKYNEAESFLHPVETVDFTDTGTFDNLNHGTNIAALVAGFNYGIAKQSKLYALKIVNEPILKNSRLFAAFEWVIEKTKASKHKSVINLSASLFNVKEGSPSALRLEQLVRQCNELGITIVNPAGNAGVLCQDYLSGIDGVITVGSVGQNNAMSVFSNYGSLVDILAPGEEISVPIAENKFFYGKTVEGTSYSTAIITGIVAVYLSVGIPPERILKTLQESGTKVEMDDDIRRGSTDIIANIVPNCYDIKSSDAEEISDLHLIH